MNDAGKNRQSYGLHDNKLLQLIFEVESKGLERNNKYAIIYFFQKYEVIMKSTQPQMLTCLLKPWRSSITKVPYKLQGRSNTEFTRLPNRAKTILWVIWKGFNFKTNIIVFFKAIINLNLLMCNKVWHCIFSQKLYTNYQCIDTNNCY